MQLTLNDLGVYVRCPLEWFWEKRAGMLRPRQTADLVPEAMRMALRFYYQGFAHSLSQAVGLVWQDWCAAWGEPAMAEDLLDYGTKRAAILNRTKRDNGQPYLAPKLTALYREQMHNAGLIKSGRRLDDFATTHGLLVSDDKNRPVGSAFGDAFADCLAAADNAKKFDVPLPAPEIVLGSDVPYQVQLSGGIQLMGTADLIWHAPPDNHEDKVGVVLEVHDFRDQLWLKPRLARHDLRVIAASLAEPVAGNPDLSEQPVTWERVAYVVYRHWLSGLAFKCYETNVGHLHSVLSSVARGMRQQIVIPRALTGYDYCRACAYRGPCWDNGGWENMHLTDPELLSRGERLRELTTQLRSTIAGNSRAAQQARHALQLVEAALAEDIPDATDLRAILAEAGHTLTMVADE